jgi:hypothetical protein
MGRSSLGPMQHVIAVRTQRYARYRRAVHVIAARANVAFVEKAIICAASAHEVCRDLQVATVHAWAVFRRGNDGKRGLQCAHDARLGAFSRLGALRDVMSDKHGDSTQP